MRISERGATLLAVGVTALLAVAFELALLANAEPLAPAGPVATIIERGIDSVASQQHGAPGVSIAVVRDGAIAMTYAHGFADIATATPVTPDTRFRAASITKMFTALCVLQLVEAGRVDLDDSVERYVPEAPHAHDVTIRQLLSHTSGLPNFLDDAFSSGVVGQATTPTAILRPLSTLALDFTPGTRFEYSNTNYVILGLLVERVTGHPLADVARDKILTVAGMVQSSFGAPPPGVPFATGYASRNATTPIPPYDPSWLFASGDLVTTASDLARFDIALMAGKIVSLTTLAGMQNGLFDMGEGGAKYGLGFSVAPFGTRTLAGHHGGVPGYAAEDEMLTNAHFAVIVLGNSSEFYTSSVNRVVLSILLPTDFAGATAHAIADAAVNAPKPNPVVATQLRKFLSGVASGSVDGGLLSPEMASALAQPAAVASLAAKLPPYGTLKTLTLGQTTTAGTSTVYFFAANYDSQTIVYQVTIDSNGRIAGFFLR